MKTRRQLLLFLGSAAFANPRGLLAQGKTATLPRIGFLASNTAEEMRERVRAFRSTLETLGYVEGKNILFEWRYATTNPLDLPSIAEELVKLNVDVIVVTSGEIARAVQKATKTIPIVMASSNDPVKTGLVASLARPGGNVTGVTNLGGDLGAKYLELLKAILPKLSRAAMLVNDNAAGKMMLNTVETSGKLLGVQVLPLVAANAAQIEAAFAAMRRERVEALAVMSSPIFIQQRPQIASLALKYRIPTLAATEHIMEHGVLISYGPPPLENSRRAATYVDKILKGAKPADLPIEQPTVIELTVNMKTAKALGVEIPQTILVRATKVIE